MPYIKSEDRDNLNRVTAKLCDKLNENNNLGEYNYVVTLLMHNYIKENGLRYEHLNNVVGMTECAKQEFVRRVVSPYEDEKIKENGDVRFSLK